MVRVIMHFSVYTLLVMVVGCVKKRYHDYDVLMRSFVEVPTIGIDLEPKSELLVSENSQGNSGTVPVNQEFVSKKLDGILLRPKAVVMYGAEVSFWGVGFRYGQSDQKRANDSAIKENQIHYASGLASFSYFDQEYRGFKSSKEFTTTYRVTAGEEIGEEKKVSDFEEFSFHDTTLKKRGLQIILNPTFNYFTLEAISGDVKPNVSSLGAMVMFSIEELVIESFPNNILAELEAQDVLPEKFVIGTGGFGLGLGGSYVWKNGNSVSLAVLASDVKVVSGGREEVKKAIFDDETSSDRTLKTLSQFGLLFPSKNGFFWGFKLIGDTTYIPRDDFDMKVTSTVAQLYIGFGH